MNKIIATVAIACSASVAIGATKWRMFASDWDTNNVYEADLGTGQLLRSVIPHRADNADTMAGMAIGADGAIYLTDFATEQVRRYNRFTGESLGVFVATGAGGFGHCTDLTFGPDGQLYAANSATGGVLRFDGNTGAFQATAVHPGLCASARFMAFSSGGLFVSDAAASSVKRFDPSTGAFVGELACCIARARGIVATAWGEVLVAGWDRGTITRFDAATGAMLGDLVTNIHANGLSIGPDGYLYACEAARHRIERYDAHTGEFLLSMVPPEPPR